MPCKCLRCGNVWNPASKEPLRCPRCKSTRWNKETVTHKCLRCGAEWDQRSDKLPKYCPACHSSMWNEEPRTFTCPKCGKIMQLRSNSRVNLCPVCDSYSDRKRKLDLSFSPRPTRPGNISRLWSDGEGLSMYYCDGSGYGIVFWQGNVIGTRRIEPLLRRCTYTLETNTINTDKELDADLSEICRKILMEDMEIDLDGELDALKAKSVELFREGMNAVSITLKLGMAFTDVMDAITESVGKSLDNNESLSPMFIGGRA